MELYYQLRKISFFFFMIVGLAHFTSGFLYINGYTPNITGLTNRVLFIPFVLASLSYACSASICRLYECGKDVQKIQYVFAAIGGFVFLALLAIELFVVDSACPLYPTPCQL